MQHRWRFELYSILLVRLQSMRCRGSQAVQKYTWCDILRRSTSQEQNIRLVRTDMCRSHYDERHPFDKFVFQVMFKCASCAGLVTINFQIHQLWKCSQCRMQYPNGQIRLPAGAFRNVSGRAFWWDFLQVHGRWWDLWGHIVASSKVGQNFPNVHFVSRTWPLSSQVDIRTSARIICHQWFIRVDFYMFHVWTVECSLSCALVQCWRFVA